MKTLLREHNNYGGSFRINSKSTQWELITLDVQERCVSLRLLGLGQSRAPLSLGSGFASAPLPQRFCPHCHGFAPGFAGLWVPRRLRCAFCPVCIWIDVTYPVTGLSLQPSCGFHLNTRALPVRTGFKLWFPHLLEV